MSEGDSGRRIVDGRFELQVRLGGGGMGTVWRAHDLLLHRSVAVKEVRPQDPGLAEYDPEAARMLRERVLREARALARVEHPNVVTIHHIVDGGGDSYPWIVMELVEGGSLADRLDQGAMTPAEAARIGQGVLSALRAAHAAGVQHRDVKPANVLLRRDGRPVLTDFGIAAVRESTTLTATGALIGTPDYMAPERISGQPGGPEADLWSLAMMLYVAVEGHHPLRKATTLATLAAVLYDEVPPPTHAGPLTAVLDALLVRDPAARPDGETVERMLAAAARPAPEQAPTSYPLAPSMPTPPPPYGPATFGPPPGMPTADVALSPAEKTVRRQRRIRSVVIVGSVVAAIVAGSLIRGQLADGNHDDASDSPRVTGTPAGATSHATAATTSPAEHQTPGKAKNLLTPDGIRTALKAIEDETGRHSYGDLTVYPEYVSAEVMVAGSRTQYDTYTYRTDGGVEKGIISSSLMGGDQPVSLRNFNWDALPSLLAQAEKKLNVDKPTTRYLVLNQPNTIFNSPAGMAVYISNDYNQSGYLQASPQGKVTKTMPYDG
ncbi:serine/threonine-protein kinase [Streptomyces sp. NPDC054833]